MSVTSERLKNATLGIGAGLRKLSARSVPKLIVATRRQSRRCLRTGTAIVGTCSAQVRVWVQCMQRSAAMLRESSAHLLHKLITTASCLSRRYLRTGSLIIGTSFAQSKAWVRSLPRWAELEGLMPKWQLIQPSSFHDAFSRPKQKEPIGPELQCASFEDEGSTLGQNIVLVPIEEGNTANNALTANASSASTLGEPHDATSVETSIVSETDVAPRREKAPVNAPSGKRRRRKRKRRGAPPCPAASPQKQQRPAPG
jgi:hypothetical protein